MVKKPVWYKGKGNVLFPALNQTQRLNPNRPPNLNLKPNLK